MFPIMHSFRMFTARFFILLIACIAVARPHAVRADWEILPESRHQLYQTYSLFFDQQSSLLNTGGAHAWGALGGTLPVYGNNDVESHPQIFFHATANASMKYNSDFKIGTETIDARVGLGYEMALLPELRFSTGLTHDSAHAADGIDDLTLFEPPVGEEFFFLRGIYDIGNTFRVGATLRPFLRAYPQIETFAADQFAEYFPFGGKDDPHSGSPYVALGFDQWGDTHLTWTTHAQLGVYFGNHFSPKFRQSARVVLGYYNGADPRMKYFRYRENRREFAYLGLMFDL